MYGVARFSRDLVVESGEQDKKIKLIASDAKGTRIEIRNPDPSSALRVCSVGGQTANLEVSALLAKDVEASEAHISGNLVVGGAIQSEDVAYTFLSIADDVVVQNTLTLQGNHPARWNGAFEGALVLEPPLPTDSTGITLGLPDEAHSAAHFTLAPTEGGGASFVLDTNASFTLQSSQPFDLKGTPLSLASPALGDATGSSLTLEGKLESDSIETGSLTCQEFSTEDLRANGLSTPEGVEMISRVEGGTNEVVFGNSEEESILRGKSVRIEAGEGFSLEVGDSSLTMDDGTTTFSGDLKVEGVIDGSLRAGEGLDLIRREVVEEIGSTLVGNAFETTRVPSDLIIAGNVRAQNLITGQDITFGEEQAILVARLEGEPSKTTFGNATDLTELDGKSVAIYSEGGTILLASGDSGITLDDGTTTLSGDLKVEGVIDGSLRAGEGLDLIRREVVEEIGSTLVGNASEVTKTAGDLSVGGELGVSGDLKVGEVCTIASASGNLSLAEGADILVGGISVTPKYFLSAELQAYINVGGRHQVEHGLGSTPRHFGAYMECVATGEKDGWLVGDRIALNYDNNDGNNRYVTVWANSTYVGYGFRTTNGTDLVFVAKEPHDLLANWLNADKWRIRLWASL